LCASDPGNLVPKTVAEDPSLPAIEINGTRLHAEAFGDPAAPALITLHGGPGGDYRCLLLLRVLADDGYEVVFWDQRGAGLSARQDPASLDLDVYLEDLRQVIDHYAPTQPVVLIGHSWGAMYATAFIDRYGDDGGRIRGAVLTEPGAFNDRQLTEFFARFQGSLSLTGEQFNDAAWSEQFVSAADHARADYLQMQFIVHGVPAEHVDPKNPPPRWRWGAAVSTRMLKIAKQGFDWTTHLSAFTHPVLFLRGDLNQAVPLSQQQELASSYPNASVETIHGVGHYVMWERTDEYLADVRAYLQTIGVAP
jgi:proline iminopeptidase